MSRKNRNLHMYLIAALLFASGAFCVAGEFVLNEFMASNGDSYTNRLGQSSDWIEIYNNSATNANLAGWRLTDDAGNLNKWAFPSTNIGPYGYVLVMADNNASSVISNELHASFQLGANGEYLALVRPNGQVVTEYAPFPEQYQDVSYGIGASAEHRYFGIATPGRTNDASSTSNVVADTKFSVDRGFYTNAFQVAITTETVGAQIRYTLNGDLPTTNSAQYSVPLNITNTTILRARAFRANLTPTDVDTHTYIFVKDVIRQSPNGEVPGTGWPTTNPYGPENQQMDYGMDPDIVNSAEYSNLVSDALLDLPSLSIVTPTSNLFHYTTGIYVNAQQDGTNWERTASAELICPDGERGFQVNCGLRIRGGWSRDGGNPKHAFRLLFRKEYGPGKLDYKLFPDDPTAAESFDGVDLAAAQNYSWSYYGDVNNAMVRDQITCDTLLRMGQPASRNRYCHLYVDGHYWGLFHFQERPEASFAESYLGGNKDDYDVMKADGGGTNHAYNMICTDGDSNAFYRLWSYTMSTGFSSVAAYSRIQGLNSDGTVNTNYENLVDVDNIADFMLLIYYSGEKDQPLAGDRSRVNNYYTVRNRTGSSGGFKYIVHDAEHTYDMGQNDNTGPMLHTNLVMFQYFNPQSLHQWLCTNAEYRLRFADRAYKRFYNGGALAPEVMVSNLSTRASQISMAIIAESARWGDSKVGTPRTKSTWLNAIANVSNVFPDRVSTVIQQLKSHGWYPNIDPPTFNQEGGSIPGGFSLTMTSSNTIYYTVDGSDPRQYGTGAAVGIVYTNGVTLNASSLVKARAMTSTNNWSALHEATFTLGDESPLRITEIMYNPRNPVGAETNISANDGDYEFVEFQNTSSSAIGLAGLKFSTGVDFDFSEGSVLSLGPYEYVLVVRDAVAFTNRYARRGGLRVAGEFVFPGNNLSDGGEELILVDALGRQVAGCKYDDGWHIATDGAGHSLVPLVMASQTNGILDYGKNWRASAYMDGSPGAADPQPVATNIVLNEIMAHTDSSDTNYPDYDSNDWIELYNTTSGDITFGNYWYLSDDAENLTKWQIPPTNIIAGKKWRYWDEIKGFHTNLLTGFGLFKGGDDVFLSYLPGGNTNRVVDAVRFRAQENGKSLGRYTDGAEFWFACALTPNAANQLHSTQTVAISEIMYWPRSTLANPENNKNDEFVELHNPGSQPVALMNTTNDVGVWRLNGGIEFAFPSNTVVPANGYVAVVSFNPTSDVVALGDFLLEYGLTNGQIQILGPYSGALGNDADNVRLERPVWPDLPGEDTTWFTVDEVSYSAYSPWPTGSAGTGKSIQRKAGIGSGDDPSNWASSVAATPGLPPAKIGLSSPLAWTGYLAPFSVDVTAEIDAGMVVNPVTQVRFYDGANLLGTDATSPYGLTVSTINTAGNHTLSAVLEDATGDNTSPGVMITVYTNAPSISAGGDQLININTYAGVSVDGNINYNSISQDLVNVAWSLYQGPAGVSFGSSTSVDTTVSFSQSGTYVLCLAATYETLVLNDYVTVVVTNSNTRNEIPYRESFEDYVGGATVVGINGWYGLDAGHAVVSISNYAAAYSGSYPISGSHEQLLGIDGAVSNLFQNTDGYTNVWADMVIEGRHWIDPDLPEVDSHAQFGLFVNSNKHMMVWNCSTGAVPSNLWTELPGTTIQSNEYVRLTLEADYSGTVIPMPRFRMWVKGTKVTNPQEWFFAASTNSMTFNQLAFAGVFNLDDLIIDDHSTMLKRITAAAGAHGAIAPSGEVFLAIGASTSFVVTVSNWYQMGSLLIDGTNAGALTYYSFTNVVEDHTIYASFVAKTATNGTPQWWFAQADASWTNGFDALEAVDVDADGMKAWEEYIAGTHPTNKASVFQMSIEQNGTNKLIQFVAVQAGPEFDGKTRYYSIDAATGIMKRCWAGVAGWTNIAAYGQTVVYTNMSTNKLYYRGRVRLQ